MKFVLKGGLRDWRPLVPLYTDDGRGHPNSFAEIFHRAFGPDTTHLAFVSNSAFGVGRMETFQQALRAIFEHPAHRSFAFTTPATALTSASWAPLGPSGHAPQ